jgi:hypothetical protein
MCNDLATWWSKRGLVVIYKAVIVCSSGQLRMQPRLAQEVQSDFCLGKKSIPQVSREVGIDCGEACFKTFLKRSDISFSRIGAVAVGGNELIAHFFFRDIIF